MNCDLFFVNGWNFGILLPGSQIAAMVNHPVSHPRTDKSIPPDFVFLIPLKPGKHENHSPNPFYPELVYHQSGIRSGRPALRISPRNDRGTIDAA